VDAAGGRGRLSKNSFYGDLIMKKIILALFLVALPAACFPEIASCNDEAIYECWEQLLEGVVF